jgi:response regulator RpfG family c-di-GMP phosphodiesterase
VAHTDGIGALASFKMMRKEQPGIPILVVSASAYPELRESLLREGALDYVLKPFDASSLAQVCKSVLKMFPELKPVTMSRPNSREANLDSTASSKPNHGELRRP